MCSNSVCVVTRGCSFLLWFGLFTAAAIIEAINLVMKQKSVNFF